MGDLRSLGPTKLNITIKELAKTSVQTIDLDFPLSLFSFDSIIGSSIALYLNETKESLMAACVIGRKETITQDGKEEENLAFVSIGKNEMGVCYSDTMTVTAIKVVFIFPMLNFQGRRWKYKIRWTSFECYSR